MATDDSKINYMTQNLIWTINRATNSDWSE